MSLTEMHMIAEIFGSGFFVVSAAFITFELHQNLKQRKIENFFARTVEAEKTFYKAMEKDFSILVTKGRVSFHKLEDYEKNQFLAYVNLIVSMVNRTDLMATEISYSVSKKTLKNRIYVTVKRHFSYPGMMEAYEVLEAQGSLVGSENFQKIMVELGLVFKQKASA